MRTRLAALIAEAQALPHLGDRHLAAVSLFRITLQHLAIGLAEWVVAHGQVENLPEARAALVRLRAPSDGTLIEVIGDLLVAAEQSQWKGANGPFWTKRIQGRIATRLCGEAASGYTPAELLRAVVEARNDAAEGHGIAGDEDPDAVLDLLDAMLATLNCWPEPADANTLAVASPDGRTVRLQLLKTFEGDLVCYRKIKRIAGAKCEVSAQRQTSLYTRTDEKWVASDVLRAGEHVGNPRYEVWPPQHTEWTPIVLLPERLTDTFKGRTEQLAELTKWFDDLDHWACMVYGDGGVGKTTLILEFMHRLLEGTLPIGTWKPTVVSYFTAKQTVWGIRGLEQLSAGSLTVIDVCRSIVQAWSGALPSKDWFTVDPVAAIDRLGALLKDDIGISRQEHLLILDNTETLATSQDEVRELKKRIEQFTKRVGRVLLTSRRFEEINAYGIELEGLTSDEAVQLLRARADELRLQALSTAGESTLRKIGDRFSRRPLVLEVFLQILASEPDLSLQRASGRVQRMQEQDLGEFLYQDAWSRLSPRSQHLVLLMTGVADVLDEALVKLCCKEVDESVLAALDALRSSRGIANVRNVGGENQVVFDIDFLKFCRGRRVKIDGKDLPTEDSIGRVRRRYDEFIVARSSQVSDRVSHAFRKPFAKLAYQAFQDGDVQGCEEYYEFAIVEDPENGALFDRYAMFLKTIGRLTDALGKAVRATDLAPDDSETWFTRGMIEARVGQPQNALVSLQQALALKKAEHLVYVQIAHAYLRMNPPDYARAAQALDTAEARTPRGTGNLIVKHQEEMRKIRRRIARRDLDRQPSN